ncbi:MAG TPA: type II toxin-antitoxin system RelE/ParE family toxin [Pirellulales bacterium]|jgi:plasmid stabilization system protein ParE|nr:type II toxin-antitoxin system RelE/ParE family toxin [Pirellulales bacterium]
MSLPLTVAPEAEADLYQAYKSLQEARPGLGARFNSAVAEVFERIEAAPEVYARIWEDVRAARLKKLRYLVYYVIFDDRIEVIAVLHGSRDSSVWQSRH